MGLFGEKREVGYGLNEFQREAERSSYCGHQIITRKCINRVIYAG